MSFQICVWIITRTYKYSTIHGNGVFLNVIKLKDLETEITLDYSGGSKVITGVLIRGREEGQGQKKKSYNINRDWDEIICWKRGKS